jgi:hypothetical protein
VSIICTSILRILRTWLSRHLPIARTAVVGSPHLASYRTKLGTAVGLQAPTPRHTPQPTCSLVWSTPTKATRLTPSPYAMLSSRRFLCRLRSEPPAHKPEFIRLLEPAIFVGHINARRRYSSIKICKFASGNTALITTYPIPRSFYVPCTSPF